MSVSPTFLNASEAARRLGISIKALRLYEQRGLLRPHRTAAGWRVYGPEALQQAADVVALRALGFSLAQIERVLTGEAEGLDIALAAHQTALEGRLLALGQSLERLRALRLELAEGQAPGAGAVAGLLERQAGPAVAFTLPWPWGGELFELRTLQPLTFITGPLGSGKTRLARRLAEALPDAGFLGLERFAAVAETQARLAADPPLGARVSRSEAWILEDGGAASPALTLLLAALEAECPATLVVDMVEEGLDEATQAALIARLRQRGAGGHEPKVRPLLLMTRSSTILDLEAVGAGEAILFCPANHAPPFEVPPWRGAPGYEALQSCLAAPDVRARSAGVVAVRVGDR